MSTMLSKKWLTAVNSKGFTLIEVLIMAPIIMVTIIIIMSFLFNQYGQLTQQGAQINLNVEAQNIVFSMQDDIFYANAFVDDLNSNLVDSHQPSGGWDGTTTPTTLLISTPAMTQNHRSASRQPVYINTVGCGSSVLEDNDALYNNIIYFSSGTTLYKRIVSAPSTLATCGTSFLKQTCPAASVTSTCQADIVLTKNLQSFTATWYDSSGNVVTSPGSATTIKVDLQLKDRAYATDIYANSTITLKKLN